MGCVQCLVVIKMLILLLILQYLNYLLSDFQNVRTEMVLPFQNNCWRPRGQCVKC